MVPWREELARRETAAAERVEGLRQQIAELTEQLAVAEQVLSRLAITRETMAEILTDAEEPAPIANSRSPIGAMLVPQRESGMDAATVLPEDYGEIMAVLAEADHGLRAGQVAVELGIPTIDRSKVEGLRSKLKRLVARGWLDQEPAGVFTITNGAVVVGD
ncbi:hypothetical protein [Nocardia yunnanensis]|nr:hypothetical protein [Nocardia yunnanensis]